MREVLLSKIREIKVTADSDYKGAVVLCPDLMKKADLREWQKVEVSKNVTVATAYVIKGKKKDCILGVFSKGDKVSITSYGTMADWIDHKPIII